MNIHRPGHAIGADFESVVRETLQHDGCLRVVSQHGAVLDQSGTLIEDTERPDGQDEAPSPVEMRLDKDRIPSAVQVRSGKRKARYRLAVSLERKRTSEQRLTPEIGQGAIERSHPRSGRPEGQVSPRRFGGIVQRLDDTCDRIIRRQLTAQAGDADDRPNPTQIFAIRRDGPEPADRRPGWNERRRRKERRTLCIAWLRDDNRHCGAHHPAPTVGNQHLEAVGAG